MRIRISVLRIKIRILTDDRYNKQKDAMEKCKMVQQYAEPKPHFKGEKRNFKPFKPFCSALERGMDETTYLFSGNQNAVSALVQ